MQIYPSAAFGFHSIPYNLTLILAGDIRLSALKFGKGELLAFKSPEASDGTGIRSRLLSPVRCWMLLMALPDEASRDFVSRGATAFLALHAHDEIYYLEWLSSFAVGFCECGAPVNVLSLSLSRRDTVKRTPSAYERHSRVLKLP